MVLRCATEQEQFILSGNVEIGNDQNTTYGVRQSFGPYGNSANDFIEPRDFGTWTGTFWMAFTAGGSQATWATGYVGPQWFESDASNVMRCRESGDRVRFEYWNGASWVDFGSVPDTDWRARWDFRFILGASGSITIYRNSKRYVASGTIDLSHVADIGRFKHEAQTGNNLTDHDSYEYIWGDEVTIGARVIVAVPTADGNYTAGSGTFANVDEEGPDGVTVDLSTNGDRHSFTHSALTSPPADWEVVTVQVDTYIRNSGSGIANARPFLRIGTTDYDKGSNLAGMDVGFQHYRVNWDTDPSTTSQWTLTDALSTSKEFGVLGQT